ncbi:hypothetical protein IAT38_006428 [Cryptococcus sp. DSM 104549]
MPTAVPVRRATPPPQLPPFKYAHRFDKPVFGDWRDELVTKGYTVVKESIPRERALEYRERAFKWLESFPLGFDRNDVSTWTNEHLPVHMKGGMFHGYGFAHEDFVWNIRCEQGVIDAFSKVWETDKLITSFDAGCIMLPKRTDVKDGGKWEHMDQSCHRRGFYCCQGVVNLNENGPDDGGFTDAQQQWFYEKGCKWVKVCAEPGDTILWDSRTLHYNVRPTGERDRVCTYVCMAPASLLTEEDREIRKTSFELYRGTTHVPFAAIYSRPHEAKLRADGTPCPYDTGKPKNPPVVTDRLLQLVGTKPY